MSTVYGFNIGRLIFSDKSPSFETVFAFAQKSGFRNAQDWRDAFDAKKFPPNFPRYPEIVYETNWLSWRKFLGVHWFNFAEARSLVIGEFVPRGINTSLKYISAAKKGLLPKGMPVKPNEFYKREWQGWGYWFGDIDARSPKRQILTHDEAMEYVQLFMCPLGIDTLDRYIRYVNPPRCLPNDPAHYYKHRGWVNSGHFFGTKKDPVGKIKNCKTIDEVKQWCQTYLKPLGITGQRKFRKYLQGKYPNAPAWPDNFPRNVENYYTRRNQWTGFRSLFED